MMTIDEAIEQEKQLSEECLKCSLDKYLECGEAREYIEYAEEHEQLAEWLEELKRLREEKSEFQIIARDNYEIGYNKAIDDCIEALKERRNKRYMQVNCDDVELKILAEQLKEGELDGTESV